MLVGSVAVVCDRMNVLVGCLKAAICNQASSEVTVYVGAESLLSFFLVQHEVNCAVTLPHTMTEFN